MQLLRSNRTRRQILLILTAVALLATGCTREYEGRAEGEEAHAVTPADPEHAEKMVMAEDELMRLDGRIMEKDSNITPGALGPVRVSENDVAVDGFDTLDSDGDGVISQAEADALPGLEAVFGDLDENMDGALNPDEFSAFEELNVEEVPKSRAEDISEDRPGTD